RRAGRNGRSRTFPCKRMRRGHQPGEAGMRGTLPEGRPGVATAEINVPPMIDVMLVLLIIFMVITPGIVRASLPSARHATYQRDRHPTLIVQASGVYTLEVDRRLE